MSDEYPFFPELPEAGKIEAQKLIDKFKAEIAKAGEAAIMALYCDVAEYIETDSWMNYRNQIMDGFRDYHNNKVKNAHDFKEIRQSILRNHREEIIGDLNQDLLAEIESLKEKLAESYKRPY